MSAITDRWAAMQSRERMMVAVLGGVLVLAIVVAAVFLVGGGGSTPTSSPTTRPTVVVSVIPTGSATPVPQTFEIFAGKDPFQPLIMATPSTAPSGSPSPGTSASPSAQPTPGQHVTLNDVFTQNGVTYATVDVNGTQYTVKTGDRFASNYTVISLSDRCGTFAFGDERFTLCIGQQVFK